MVSPNVAQDARRSLDAKIGNGSLRALADRPVRGWIRAIRDALGMTSHQLAVRMGTSQPAVSQLERSEIDDRVTLATLRRAADALDCDLVYALVPRTTLDEAVRRRARALARRDLAAVDQTMRLEDQALPADELDSRVEAYAVRLLSEGRLWDGPAA
jgi:predicted DNA-binding mobile mystery protein A